MTTMTGSQILIKTGDLRFSFLNSGDIYEVTHKKIMINQLIGNPIDGSLNNIYLRLHKSSEIQVFPLLGVRSASKVHFTENQVVWQGTAEQLQYQVTFSLTEQGTWFWDVTVQGHDIEIDLIYGQDLGLAEKGTVRSNEAFVSQYIDHRVFEDASKGYVVCSRQNQPQQGTYPYLQQGALTKATGYLTDGFQFFGLSYKETNEPEALKSESLANEVYQYEFAYIALQSERLKVSDSARFVFYGLFKEDHPTAVTTLEFENELKKAWESVKAKNHQQSVQSADKVSVSPELGAPLQTLSMTKEEIDHYFPNRHQEEWEGETLLSFFTDTHEHVVLKEKELLVERPHGHIILSGQSLETIEDILTSTSYMYGIFNSQLVVGNTSFNKLLTNVRNHLNVIKTSGQRIYVEMGDKFHLLTMPSMFEMGFNYARWYYKTAGELLMITNFTTVDSPELQLHVRSASGKAYRYLVTNQVSMNNNEYEAPFRIKKDKGTISFYAGVPSDSADVYPDLRYRMHVIGADITLEDEQKLAVNAEPGSASLVALNLSAASEWTITVQGSLYGEERPFIKRKAELEIERYRAFFQNVMNGFHLSRNGVTIDKLEKINALAWWFTHNMLVHYAVPHGLEQYGGAAWGTRDVCQGPAEYFIATQKYGAVRNIIKTVFSHQYKDDGNWPQWFMFDKYFTIQQEESHGDIIVWPLKVVSDYLSVTKDYSLLQEKVPYTQRGSHKFTEESATILEHLKKEIGYIKQHFLHETYLSPYGDGDWDDTLQPANPQLRKYLVSSWTVALTYQALGQMAQVLTEADPNYAEELQSLALGIEADFKRYMLQTEVIPGFIYMEQSGKAELMLHPSDTRTGIQYRLLPMTRSIISELLTPKQAEAHYQIIKQKLYYPDGVRLMNQPAHYKGGVCTHFKRAEQAANFGREIGLQYVHAHIRFIEAMAKLGRVEEVWKGLETVNPIDIQKVVPNAERRQSNTYFSSSDGKFSTRYEAQERFQDLREGTVPVKGGWRIYSSGPGIYMNQLISNCLGIRQAAGDLILDPVLPDELDGLQFHFGFKERPVTFIYHIHGQTVKRVIINGNRVETDPLPNRYRQGGIRIAQQELDRFLQADANRIEIFM